MARRRTKILTLVTMADEQRQAAIDVLKDTLARAEAGEIEQVAVAYVKRGGIVGSAFSDCYAGQLLGATALLTARLARSVDN